MSLVCVTVFFQSAWLPVTLGKLRAQGPERPPGRSGGAYLREPSLLPSSRAQALIGQSVWAVNKRKALDDHMAACLASS
jgi:hypothetical protein